MGLFLAMSGVASTDKDAVGRVLRDYSIAKGGTCEPLTEGQTVGENEQLMIAESPQGNVTVMYPNHFLEWEEASRHLSEALNTPVFSFHIHDGDIWMYLLFQNGNQIDQFNPLPNYWDEVDAVELETWAGNAEAVCEVWPNVLPGHIGEYLVCWDNLEDEHPGKAYPKDEFEFGSEWQMADFMAKVGLVTPVEQAAKDKSSVSVVRFSVPDRTPPKSVEAKPTKADGGKKAKSWWQRLFIKD